MDWKNVVIPVVTVIAAGVASFSGATFAYLNKDRELDIRMVDIGLSLLSGKNEGATSVPARGFALRVLSKYSGVDIPADEFQTWVSEGIVSFGDTPSIVLSDGTEWHLSTIFSRRNKSNGPIDVWVQKTIKKALEDKLSPDLPTE